MSIGHNAIIIWGDCMANEANRLRSLRKLRGFSQVKMQILTGIDQSDYSKIESGKRNFTFEQCWRIALALDTSMD